MAIGRIPEPGTGIQESIVDAKGDLISATAADTPARLAVGANGTTLVANSSTATGLEWATLSSGGMSLISTTSVSGASVTLSSIPQTFVDLYVVIKSLQPVTGASDARFRFNADSTASRHGQVFTTTGGNITTYGNDSFTQMTNSAATTNNGITTLYFFDYTNATTTKMARVLGVNTDHATPTSFSRIDGTALYNQTGAISSLSIFNSSGNFTSGTILLYGVK